MGKFVIALLISFAFSVDAIAIHICDRTSEYLDSCFKRRVLRKDQMLQSSILVSGTYQRSRNAGSIEGGRYSFMLDCKAVSKIDSVYSGILELGFDGKLGFSGQPSMPLLKSDDNWTIFAYWFESRKKLVRPTFLIQVNSTLINQYDPETRLLQQGFFLPATFHMAYGWKLLQDSNAWSIDLMVADFRWKRYKASGQELTISYAEVGAFIKFQFNGTISKFLTAVVAFEGEFANSNRDGYSYRASSRVTWSVWGPMRISMVSTAQRDRPDGRSLWSAFLTIGFGFDWKH
ncbi:MAG TPA: hypothetical protein P5523_07560 [Bacteroidales bacterium]|jgi:hypothetical protein|nr:hypothetical protein [Bacteroidales bacterium]